MATIKIGWILLAFLGWSSAGLMYLWTFFGGIRIGDIQLSELGEPYRTLVVVIGISFMIVQVSRGVVIVFERVENLKEKRIANREREYELKLKISRQLNKDKII